MKTKIQIYLVYLFILSGLAVHAQTLTCQFNCPKPGEIYSIKTSSPVLHTSGLNQLWNFSQVQAVSTGVIMVSYEDPVSVASSSLYTPSNLAKLEAGNYTFLNSGNNGITLCSANNTSVNAQSFVIPFPFSYGSSHTETIVTTYLSGNDTIQLKTIKQLNGIGSGTLMLPTATYKDVVRISGQITESRKKNGVPESKVITNTINYYYSEKISHPLLYSEYKYDNENNDYAPITKFVANIHTGLNQEKDEAPIVVTVAPNPSSGNIWLSSSSKELGLITLSNLIGNFLLKEEYNGTAIKLDVSHLPTGFYTLQLLQGNYLYKKKIVIQKT